MQQRLRTLPRRPAVTIPTPTDTLSPQVMDILIHPDIYTSVYRTPRTTTTFTYATTHLNPPPPNTASSDLSQDKLQANNRSAPLNTYRPNLTMPIPTICLQNSYPWDWTKLDQANLRSKYTCPTKIVVFDLIVSILIRNHQYKSWKCCTWNLNQFFCQEF